jgi:hypothetical protein
VEQTGETLFSEFLSYWLYHPPSIFDAMHLNQSLSIPSSLEEYEEDTNADVNTWCFDLALHPPSIGRGNARLSRTRSNSNNIKRNTNPTCA